MRNPKLLLLQRSPSPQHISHTLVDLRLWFERQINQLWQEPYASFLAGLLIGSRKGIPQEVLDVFQETGLTHIIAISGYNITLLIVIITTFLGFLPKRLQIMLSILTIIGFTILVGASAAVVRASIMGILGLIALLTYRKSIGIVSLLCTASLMVLHTPFIILYDVGFQLSFLAVLGLMYVAPLLEPLGKIVPSLLGIRESLLLTISATITTTPIILYHFGSFSVTSPIANILVAPFLPLSMLFGFLSVVGTPLLGLLTYPLRWLTALSLEAVIFFARLCSSVPNGYMTELYIDYHLLLLMYLLIIFLLIYATHRLQFFSNDTASPE